MAIYHLSAQVISRSAGRSSVAAAAYRSGQVLTDERTGTECRYTRRQERVLHAEILAPAGAPAWASDRQPLWNAAEAAERRKDAQVAREVEVALPVELAADQRLELVRDWTRRTFVEAHGLVADLAVHQDPDERNPHCHILLTTRALHEGDGFGPKARHLNERDQLVAWRESWAEAVNSALARAGHEARVDHRSLEAQGIDREPTVHEGWAARRIGATADRVRLNIEIRARNRQLELAASAWAPEIGAQGLSEPSKPLETPQAAPQARPAPLPGRQSPVTPPVARTKRRKRPPTVADELRAALDAGVGGLRDLITLPARRVAERRAEGEARAERMRFAEEGRVDAWRRALHADPTLIRAPIDRVRDPDLGIERFMVVVDVRRVHEPMPSPKILPQVWAAAIEVQDACDRERQREQKIDQERAENARQLAEQQASWDHRKEIWARIDAWLEAVRADPTLFRDRIDPERDHGQPLHRFQEVIDTSRVKLPLPTSDMMLGLWKQLQYLQEEWDRKAEAEVLFLKAARRHARHLHLRGRDTHNTRTGARGHRAPTGRSGPSGRNR